MIITQKMKKYMLLNMVLLAVFIGSSSLAFAQITLHRDALYKPDKTRIEEDCDYRSYHTSSRPSELFVMTCWQNGVQILREACLSIPRVEGSGAGKNVISTSQFLQPLFVAPSDAACLIRHMDDEDHERD